MGKYATKGAKGAKSVALHTQKFVMICKKSAEMFGGFTENAYFCHVNYGY
jgi:hypothetical protein